MVLVDTSIWIDHFNQADPRLMQLLETGQVLMHPFIIGELACGNLKPRDEILNLLSVLPAARMASHDEVLYFLEANHFYSKGIGWVDSHLLASTALERTASIWTRDKRLDGLAQSIGLGFLA
jgi:hypothetical protein